MSPKKAQLSLTEMTFRSVQFQARLFYGPVVVVMAVTIAMLNSTGPTSTGKITLHLSLHAGWSIRVAPWTTEAPGSTSPPDLHLVVLLPLPAHSAS